MTTVAIVVLTYNQRSFIRKTLSSIINQTYTNIRVLVSDDCSTDGTYDDVCAFISDAAPFISCRRNSKNIGISAHINLVVSQIGAAELVGIFGGDDISHPDRVASIVEAWQNDKQALIVSSYVKEISWADMPVNEERSQLQDSDLFSKFQLNSQLEYLKRISPILTLGAANFYRGDFLKRHKIPNKFPYEDHFYYFHALQTGNVIVLQDHLLSYRIHPSSSSHSVHELPSDIFLYGVRKDLGRSVLMAQREITMACYYLRIIITTKNKENKKFESLAVSIMIIIINLLLIVKIRLFSYISKTIILRRFTGALYDFLSYNPLSNYAKSAIASQYLNACGIKLTDSILVIIGLNLNGRILYQFFQQMTIVRPLKVISLTDNQAAILHFFNSKEYLSSEKVSIMCSSKRAEKSLSLIFEKVIQVRRCEIIPRGVVNRLFRLVF